VNSALVPICAPKSLIVDANIAGNGWYVMADPAMCPTVVYGYVAGMPLSTGHSFLLICPSLK
jgi:hypothetical protein